MHRLVAHVDDLALAVAVVVDSVLGAHLGGLAVEVDDARAAGLLVEVVDVLRDDRHVVAVLQGRYRQMSGVGLSVTQLGALHVVEVEYELAVLVPALDRCDLHRVVVVPEASVIAVGPEPALCAHACAGEHGYLLFHGAIP